MSDAEQPTRLKRAGTGLGWAGLLLAMLLAIFVLVPLGANEGMSATTPATNSTPNDDPAPSSPETWVLSSTVVTSTPAEDASDAPQADADQARAAPQSTPLIIQVPNKGPTTRPTTAPTTVSTFANTSGTTSSDAETSTSSGATAAKSTCTELTPTKQAATEATATEGVLILPGDVGSSGDNGDPLLESVLCES